MNNEDEQLGLTWDERQRLKKQASNNPYGAKKSSIEPKIISQSETSEEKTGPDGVQFPEKPEVEKQDEHLWGSDNSQHDTHELLGKSSLDNFQDSDWEPNKFNPEVNNEFASEAQKSEIRNPYTGIVSPQSNSHSATSQAEPLSYSNPIQANPDDNFNQPEINAHQYSPTQYGNNDQTSLFSETPNQPFSDLNLPNSQFGYPPTDLGPKQTMPAMPPPSMVPGSNKPKELPKVALIAGGVVVAIVTLIATIMFFNSDDSKEIATDLEDESSEAGSTSTVTTPQPVYPQVSLDVIPELCQNQGECAVSGPLDSNVSEAYKVTVTPVEGSSEVPPYKLFIDDEEIEDPTAPFGFGNDSGRHKIEVQIDGIDQEYIFEQYAFDKRPGYYILISTIGRADPGFASAIEDYDSLIETHPELVLIEGISLSEELREEYVLYVGGFSDEAEAESYCSDKGLSGEACEITELII